MNRHATRLLGRAAEWEALAGGLESARGGRLELFVLSGPSGSGKSRLVEELRQHAVRRGFTLDETRYERVDVGPGYGLCTLVRGRFGLPPQAPATVVKNTLADQFAQKNPFAEPGREALAQEFFTFAAGVDDPAFKTHQLDPQARWEGAFAELARFVEGAASQAPTVWLLEDAHFGDGETARFIDFCLSRGSARGLMLVVTVREDRSGSSEWVARLEDWRARGAVNELRLSPLPLETVATLLVDAADGRLAKQTAQKLAAQAEGNPLFALELLELASNVPDVDNLPSTQDGLLRARLSLLGEPALALAQRGSLIGRQFPLSAVRALWTGAPGSLEEAIAELSAAELVESGRSAERELHFTRARYHEAAQAGISPGDRAEWLRALETWARGQLSTSAKVMDAAPQLASIVARALSERGEHEEASYWHELGALQLRRHHRLGEATAALKAALEHAEGTRRLVLLRRLVEEEVARGEVKRALDLASGAGFIRASAKVTPPAPLAAAFAAFGGDPLDAWEKLSPEEAALGLELARAEAVSQLGEAEQTRNAFEAIERRLSLVSGSATVNLWVRWVKTWAWFVGEVLGSPKEAERACARAREAIGAEAAASAVHRAALLRAEQISASRVGDSERARSLADELLALTQAQGNTREEVSAWNAKGILHMSAGELFAARAAFDRSRQLASTVGLRRREAIALHNLGLVLADLGLWDAATRAQEEYLARSTEIANRPARGYAPASLAVVSIARGELNRATTELAQARREAEENSWPFVVAWTRGLSGHLRLLRFLEDRDRLHLGFARTEYRACLDVLDEQGIAWTEELDPGEFHLGLALVLLHQGRPQEAKGVLARAQQELDPNFVTSHAWVRAGLALVDGKPLGEALEWFRQRQHQRAVQFLERLMQG